MNKAMIYIFLFLFTLISFSELSAHVYPEHRKVTALSFNNLNDSEKEILNDLWSELSSSSERLSNQIAFDSLHEKSIKIDFAAWPAIAGDHSCSPSNLIDVIFESDWIIDVNQIGNELGNILEKENLNQHDRLNALRNSDFKLLYNDPEYATRAGGNNIHFLLPREFANMELREYLEGCNSELKESNSLSAYTFYHYNALIMACKLRDETRSDERNNLLKLMFASEAFALHFLEDMFAAGHITGTWGAASKRKGTHDFYNEKGLLVETWNGDSFVVMGDAWLNNSDSFKAAQTVSKSLKQIIEVFKSEECQFESLDYMQYNSCLSNSTPDITYDDEYLNQVIEVIGLTPKPGLSKGVGSLPRYNSEIGPFLGISTALRGLNHNKGFLPNQTETGAIGGIQLNFRIGLGIEGIVNESSDGQIFLDVGISRESASTADLSDESISNQFGAITTLIPARSSTVFRLRSPYYLIPGDLILAAPILYLISPDQLTKMAALSINGGILGLQSGIETSFGRFQFLLGREIGVYIYSSDADDSRIVSYQNIDGVDELALLDIQTIGLEIPFLEYRLFRSFSESQSSSINIQLFFGVDIPIKVNQLVPFERKITNAQNVYQFGLKFNVNWRNYFEF